MAKEREYLLGLSSRCSQLAVELGEAGLHDSSARMESVLSTVQAEVNLQLLGKTSKAKKGAEGWAWVGNDSSYHYFRKGKSLCRKYLFPSGGKFYARLNDQPYHCRQCVKGIEK